MLHPGVIGHGGRHGGHGHPAALSLPAVGMGGHVAIVNVGCDVSKEFSTDGIGGSVEDLQIHRHIVGQKEITDGIHRYLQRLILRIVMHPGEDQRKSHRFTTVAQG